MEALIGLVGLLLVAGIGGGAALWRRKGATARKEGSVSAKLDIMLPQIASIVTDVAEVKAYGATNSEGIKTNSDDIRRLGDSLNARMDSHMEHHAAD